MKQNVHPKETELVSPDGGYGWVVVACAFFCIFVTDGVCYSYGLYINAIADHFSVSIGVAAVPGAVVNAMCGFMGPIAGVATNKFGSRLVVATGALIATSAIFLCIFVKSFTYFCILYAIFGGFGLCLVYVPVVVHVGIFFDKRRALATGIAMSGSGIGIAFISYLSPIFIARFGWQGTQIVIAGMILQCIVCAVLLREPRYPESRSHNFKPDDKYPIRYKRGIVDVITDPIMILNIVSNVIGTLGYSIPIVFTVTRVEDLGATHSQAGTLLTVYGICSTLGRILTGYIADNTRLSALTIIVIGMVVCSGLTMLSTIIVDYYLIVIYMGIYGFCICAFISFPSVVVADYFGVNNLSKFYGLVMMSRGMALAMGSPVGGALYNATGSYAVMYCYAGCLMLTSAVVSTVMAVVSGRITETKKNVSGNVKMQDT